MIHEFHFMMRFEQMEELLELVKEKETFSTIIASFDLETYSHLGMVMMTIKTTLSIPYELAYFLGKNHICCYNIACNVKA